MKYSEIRDTYVSLNQEDYPADQIKRHDGPLPCSNIWGQGSWNWENTKHPGFRLDVFDGCDTMDVFGFSSGNQAFYEEGLRRHLDNPTLTDWKCVYFELDQPGIFTLVWLSSNSCPANYLIPLLCQSKISEYGSDSQKSTLLQEYYCRVTALKSDFKLLLELPERAYIVERQLDYLDWTDEASQIKVTRITSDHNNRIICANHDTRRGRHHAFDGWKILNFKPAS